MEGLKKEFVPYPLALRLKAIGFDEPCLAFYYDKTKFLSLGENPKYLVDQRKASYIFGNEKHGVTLAPTFSAAFRWFREKYNIDGFIQVEPLNKLYGFVIYNREINNYIEYRREFSIEQAELTCLDKLLEIVEFKSESNGNPID